MLYDLLVLLRVVDFHSEVNNVENIQFGGLLRSMMYLASTTQELSLSQV